MQGLMMNYPLTLPHILERAGKLFPKIEIVSRLPDKKIHRTNYGEFYKRTRLFSEALQKAGLKPGDRVATLCWNHYRHLEAYFGIPCAGGVLHTLNLRLHADDIAYIASHAEDRFLVVDDVLLPVYEQFKGKHKFERVFVIRSEGKPLPAGCEDYEDLLKTASGKWDYPKIDENDALGMCYTSGTTGKPKGVLYSHRAIVLHTLCGGLVDNNGICHNDSLLLIVPMFHANGWALPFICAMVGSKLVLPGPHVDPESVLQLFDSERVTFSAGVPTVWQGVLEALDKNPGKWRIEKGARLACGGSAPPEALMRGLDRHGLYLKHLWGMTELSPLGTAGYFKQNLGELPDEKRYAIRKTQGLPIPYVDCRIWSDTGEAPWDGKTMGELQVRGPWVAGNYFKDEGEGDKWTKDGWFRTGDVAVIDEEGYVKLTDRTKDLIKSGGEWISSVDLENAIMGHPAVREAAVIAIPHPKWDERPLAVVVKKDGADVTLDELKQFLAPKFAKWWLPEGLAFVPEIPHTSTGKIQKLKLREQFQNWKW
ncbi:MAG: long-chain fatty acid--CoA ligase [Bdellovibrionota bacterium]